MTHTGPVSGLTLPRFHRPIAWSGEELLGWLWCRICHYYISTTEGSTTISISIYLHFPQCESPTKAKRNTSTHRNRLCLMHFAVLIKGIPENACSWKAEVKSDSSSCIPKAVRGTTAALNPGVCTLSS